MIEQLNQLYEDFKVQLSEITDMQQLDNLKTHFLGKKSPMGNILRGLKDATPEERKELGMKSNEIKNAMTDGIEARREDLKNAAINESSTLLMNNSSDFWVKISPLGEGIISYILNRT